MHWIEANFNATDKTTLEIVVAMLAEIGFESFVEEENILRAYIIGSQFDENNFDSVITQLKENFQFDYDLKNIPYQNWNALWESNFTPVELPGELRVRALFHDPDPSFPLEIIIQPKMSFGTGHHATTSQVMQLMLGLDFSNKKVLDFGTGSGILAILAKKLGASYIRAIDNDLQCIENAAENFELNDCNGISLSLGDIRNEEESFFDIIIANITRNTILEYMNEIAHHLLPESYFICSGFYVEDLALITTEAKAKSLKFIKNTELDRWCAALFVKDK